MARITIFAALATSLTFPAAVFAQPMTLEEAAAEIQLLKEQIQRLEQALPKATKAEKPKEEQFNIAARAIFLKPTLNNFDIYGAKVVGDNGDNTIEDLDFKSLDYDYSTGIEVVSSYQFADSSFGIRFEYAALSAEESDSFITGALGGGRFNSLENEEHEDEGVKTVSGKSKVSVNDWKIGSTYS